MISRKLLSENYLVINYSCLEEALLCLQESYAKDLPETNSLSLQLTSLLFKGELLLCLTIYKNPLDHKNSMAQTIFFSFDWENTELELESKDEKKIQTLLNESIDFIGQALETMLIQEGSSSEMQIMDWPENKLKNCSVFIKTERINMLLYLMADNILNK